MKVKFLSVTILIILLIPACGPVVILPGAAGASQPQSGSGSAPDPAPASPLETKTPLEEKPPALPPVLPEQTNFGPNLEDFPPGYNPLTGQPVADPSLLELPAVLISISHFPASARPLWTSPTNG